MQSPHLAEDHVFQLVADEDLYVDTPTRLETGWGADPMEILMAKQELERMELETEFLRH